MSKAENPQAGGAIGAALQSCRRHLIYAGIFSGFINILYLVPSIYMLQVYNRVVPTRGVGTLILLTLVLVVCLGVFAMLDMIRMQLLQRLSMRVERIAAPSILMAAMNASRAPVSARVQAINDLDTVRTTMMGPAVIALFDAPWAPIYIIVSALLHPLLGLFALFCCIVLIGLAYASDRATSNAVRSITKQSNEATQAQEMAFRTSEVSRALGMTRAMVNYQLNQRTGIVSGQGKTAHISGRYLAVTKFCRLLFQSLSLGLGAYLAVQQQISAGAIFAASLILGRALAPIEQITGALKSVTSARAAYRNLLSIDSALGVEGTRTKLPDPTGMISVEGLTIMAPGTERPLLMGINFWVEPGEVIALVGPSGAGKSTLLRAIAGVLPATRGEVRLDNALHNDWDRDALGRHIGYMPQDPTLMPFTVRENVSRFAGWVNSSEDSADLDRRIVEAAKLSGAHDIIMRLAKGYETDLGSRAVGLSAGQSQTIALARALFDWPKIVLLDEPNAHLDSDGENRLLQTISELKARKSSVIVSSHRTSVLQIADKVLVLRDGKVHAFADRDQFLRPNDRLPAEAAKQPAAEARVADSLPGEQPNAPAADSPASGQGDSEGKDSDKGGASQ